VKTNLFITLIVVLVLSSCNLFLSGPSAAIKQLMADSERGDIDAMVNAWSRKAVEEMGADSLRKGAQSFAAIVKKAREQGENLQITKLRDSVQGDRARVFFLYGDPKAQDSVSMGFAMIKEDGKWKVYRGIDVGDESEPFDSSFTPKKSAIADSTPAPDASPLEVLTAPPPPPANSNRAPATNSNSAAPPTSNAPVSAGLRNSKAIRLPKPSLPATAKAAKASGTVLVNVLVDENGNVMTADAVSGHPLLREAAEQAARIAHFQPTLVGGQRVKVKGSISYNFPAE
jgi:TonB family protein